MRGESEGGDARAHTPHPNLREVKRQRPRSLSHKGRGARVACSIMSAFRRERTLATVPSRLDGIEMRVLLSYGPNEFVVAPRH